MEIPCLEKRPLYWNDTGGRLNIKMSSYQYRDPMLKIRRFRDRLIFNTWIPYLEKTVFILRQGPGVAFFSLTRPLAPQQAGYTTAQVRTIFPSTWRALPSYWVPWSCSSSHGHRGPLRAPTSWRQHRVMTSWRRCCQKTRWVASATARHAWRRLLKAWLPVASSSTSSHPAQMPCSKDYR